MLAADVVDQLAHEITVQMYDFAAFRAFKVQMPLTAMLITGQLIAVFAAVLRREPKDKILMVKTFQISIYSCDVRLRSGFYQHLHDIISRDCHIRIRPQTVQDGHAL